MHTKVLYGLLLTTFMAILGFVSCNKDFEKRIDTNADPDTTIHKANAQNKVLYIVVDNGIGKVLVEQSIRDNVYPNISTITKTAIYSGISLSDANNDDATTFADMFTGVRKAKHEVLSETGTNNLGEYHSFVENIEDINPALTTSAFVQSDFIYNQLVDDAATKQLLSSDQEVQTVAAADITSTDAAVVVTQFTGLKKAGDADGYGPDSQAYLQALESFDGFLGTLLDAIKSRPNAGDENWVVIVASNKGALYTLAEGEDDGSDFSNTQRNGFIIISNPDFNLDYYQAPDLRNYSVNGMTPTELGPSDRQASLNSESADIYNIGTEGNYTIWFKANITSRSTNSTIPAIMTKTSSPSGGSPTGPGWAMILHGDSGRENWSFRINGTANTGPDYELNVWNTFVAVIYDSADKRFVRTFLNGEGSAPTDITGKQGTSVSSMIIGGGPSYGANSFRGRMIDIRIYNEALSADYIADNYCKTYVNSDEPYAENLIGYWPGIGMDDKESSEKTFVDFSPSKRDVKFGSAAEWSAINLPAGPTICPVYPEKERSKIPYSVDIPRFIYAWLGIFNVNQFDLDGKLITPTYRTTGSTN